MDSIKYAKNGWFFTWDEKKAQANRQKHRIDKGRQSKAVTFEMAAEAFLDKDVREFDDEEKIAGEIRYKIIGRPSIESEFFLLVVYTEWSTTIGTVIRIISARPAMEQELERNESGDYNDYAD